MRIEEYLTDYKHVILHDKIIRLTDSVSLLCLDLLR